MVLLHPAFFQEVYERRFVNNIYFDTHDRSAYFEAVNGDPNRLKIRVRWYGELMGQIERSMLELKLKCGQVGSKQQFGLEPFALDEYLPKSNLQQVFEASSLPDATLLYLSMCEPTLINRYRRRYFQSADMRIRITIDTDLTFYPMNSPELPWRLGATKVEGSILEIKYDRDSNENALQSFAGFPFRLTKSSKYVLGMSSAHEF